MGSGGPVRPGSVPWALVAGLVLPLALAACASRPDGALPRQGFAALSTPARVAAPAPAEEIVSRFDEGIDTRALPRPRPADARSGPIIAGDTAGRRRLSSPLPNAWLGAPDPLAAPSAAESFPAAERLAAHQLRLVQVLPWRAGIELYTDGGICVLVGSDSLVDERDGDPVSIQRSLTAFEGDSLAILGLRVRY